MVTARRIFAGRLALSTMARLAASLADTVGEVEYEVEFDRDEQAQAYLQLKVDARLPLICQRTLERFELPVHIRQRLGVIRREQDEAGLPEGYEPMLLPADGGLRIADAIEDELILAVPVVPMSDKGLLPQDVVWQDAEPEMEQLPESTSPFAVLGRLKQKD
ncbi:MAG TPA: YceD family protein [Chiayiivirga sp.]|nr:YceD family protein [Chiayiivirga sp.]